MEPRGDSPASITGAHVENIGREVINGNRRRVEEVNSITRMQRSLRQAQQELPHVRQQMASDFKVLGDANLSAEVKKQIRDIERTYWSLNKVLLILMTTIRPAKSRFNV